MDDDYDPDENLSGGEEARVTSEAEGRAMAVLADGKWHRTSRTDALQAQTAAYLWRKGLLERRGSSRTTRPSNPGYEYRLREGGEGSDS